MRKIVNIVIFAVAILACILTVWFAGSFNDKSKDKYYAVSQTKESNPEIIAELENATIESLPEFINANNVLLDSIEQQLNAEELQKDIFYTYLRSIEALDNEQKFNDFKANFPAFSESLFAKSNQKEQFIEGFNALANYDALFDYKTTLKKDYDVCKQSYLQKNKEFKALKSIVKLVSDINAAKSVDKKKFDLNNFQNEIKSFGSQASLINVVVYIIYALFIAALVMLLAFVVYHLFTNSNTSKVALFGILGLIVIVIVCYFISPAELSQSAIKEQLTPNAFKWIGSAVLTTYILVIAVILSIVGTAIAGVIKKNR